MAITYQYPQGRAMAGTGGGVLTLDEVAAYQKAGKRTDHRFAAEKKIPAFKLGGTWRFRTADFERRIGKQTMGNSKRGGKA